MFWPAPPSNSTTLSSDDSTCGYDTALCVPRTTSQIRYFRRSIPCHNRTNFECMVSFILCSSHDHQHALHSMSSALAARTGPRPYSDLVAIYCGGYLQNFVTDAYPWVSLNYVLELPCEKQNYRQKSEQLVAQLSCSYSPGAILNHALMRGYPPTNYRKFYDTSFQDLDFCLVRFL